MGASNEPRQHAERASFVAVGSAAMFGFGPVSVGYFAQIAGVSDLSASVRVTTLYFLAVYAVVVLFGFLLRVRSFGIPRLWRALSPRGRTLLVIAAAANAVSGWCFFDMLDRVDPLSAAVIMALSIVFNLFAARLLLGEEIRLSSAAGRRKWVSFGLIAAGVLITSLYSSLSGGGPGLPEVTFFTLLVGFASSLFAALRTVGVKGALNALPSAPSASGMQLGPALAVTRFVYLAASLFTFLVTLLIATADPTVRFTARDLLLPNPFIAELGLVYGAAYALNYIAMSRIEASRTALITRSSIAFTALYMIVAASVFGVGRMPSLIEAPAALLVSFGAYLAARPGGPRVAAGEPVGHGGTRGELSGR